MRRKKMRRKKMVWKIERLYNGPDTVLPALRTWHVWKERLDAKAGVEFMVFLDRQTNLPWGEGWLHRLVAPCGTVVMVGDLTPEMIRVKCSLEGKDPGCQPKNPG